MIKHFLLSSALLLGSASAVADIPPAGEFVARLRRDYDAALAELGAASFGRG